MLQNLLLAKHLEDDESLVRVVHKHWLIGCKHLFWSTVFLVLGLSIVFVSRERWVLLIASVWCAVGIVWWLRSFFDYYLDAWLVTDQGIIDIAWHGWFHRQSTRVLYSDLQGVSYEIHGVTGTLLRYGIISVEKISTGSAISLEFVRHPKRIEMIILRQMEEYLHKKNLKDSKHIQELLSALVAERVQMNDLTSDDV